MTPPRVCSAALLSALAASSIISVVGCGGGDASPDAPPDVLVVPTANPAREILDTRLAFDVTAHTGTATITFGPSATQGATLEVGDLSLTTVGVPYAPGIATTASARPTIDLALAPSDAPVEVEVAFGYQLHTGYQGARAGFTFLWPYFCGNLFPCHSEPSDGTTLSLSLTGVPADQVAVYPTTMVAEAPAYQLAWSIDAYTELPLGATTAGTALSTWYRPAELAAAEAGTANLVAVFDWLERTIGPYRYGPKAGSVSVRWGSGAYGGMEHHPYWHVSSTSLADQETHAHEAAHGWFGDGIRVRCWEDFVLSEGTVTYLAGRALDVVAPSVGAQVWAGYASQLAGLPASNLVWPQGCGAIDVIADDLYQEGPYIRGAFFYRAVALKVGTARLDEALAAFYAARAGTAASMTDMLTTIREVTGYDPTACAAMWLTSTTKPAAETPCP